MRECNSPDDVSSLLMCNLELNEIQDCENYGPRKQLTLVCDNCSGQNKNGTVLKFLCMLVEKKYYKKIQILFYLQGTLKIFVIVDFQG